jgi:hypothetical protein
LFVRFVSEPPSGSIVKISPEPFSSKRVKPIFSPSGDHVTYASLYSRSVSWTTSLPSASILYRWKWAPVERENTICEPSGDQAGSKSSARSFVGVHEEDLRSPNWPPNDV